jgi:hypothetical protein
MASSQAAKHQHVVLRGVVVMRGQLVVEQVGDVQIHQLHAAQGLQHGLHLALHHLELAACTGDPDKTLRWQLRADCRFGRLCSGCDALP